MKEKKDIKSKYAGKIMDLGFGIEITSDSNQYTVKIDNNTFHYSCIEYLLEDVFEMKRKEFAAAGKDKSVEGFIKATLKAKEWMEKAVEIKYANPYEAWRKDYPYRTERGLESRLQIANKKRAAAGKPECWRK